VLIFLVFLPSVCRTFEERQLQYRIKEKQRQDALLREKELQSNNWFRPQVDARSSQIVKESRPEVMLESASQRAERLAITDAAQMEERRRRRAAEVYGAMTFTPAIDPLSRQLGECSCASLQENIPNAYALRHVFFGTFWVTSILSLSSLLCRAQQLHRRTDR
jgi:hypothetical protein